MDNRMDRKDIKQQRNVKKLKKKIDKLMHLGGLTEQQKAIVRSTSNLARNLLVESSSTGGSFGQLHQASTSRASLALNKIIAEKKNANQGGPGLVLTLQKLNGSLAANFEIGTCIQFATLGPPVTRPKWMTVKPWKGCTQTMLVRINCPDHYIVHDGGISFDFVSDFFEKKWIRLGAEVSDKNAFWESMCNVPISMREQIREKSMLEDPNTGLKCVKSSMVLTSVELIEHEYPMPDEDHISTKKRYLPLTESSPMFAIDCEMCITSAHVHELCRVSLIREDGSVVFDTLVKPENRITNYLTEYSGLTEEMLADVNVTLADVQRAIQEVLPPDAILVGHSMHFDLKALKMAHPYCIDVAVAFNMSGNDSKTSLKNLVYLFLNKNIQNGVGHCSVEDAWAAMQLAKLKIEKGLIYGNRRFGWETEDWNKIKKELEEKDDSEEPMQKRAKTEPAKGELHTTCNKIKCVCKECGNGFGIECIVENCLCQVNPPNFCIKCLSQPAPVQEVLSESSSYDWKEALRVDNVSVSRPLNYYMTESSQPILCGFDIPKSVKLPDGRKFMKKPQSSAESIDGFVEQCAADMINYKLGMVDLDYHYIAEEMETLEDEEGEVIDELTARQQVARQIDDHAEKLIRAAAKFCFVLFVFSSPKHNILYLRVKS
ncbi:hypothetical protein WR25_11015 [Diploscapter pachys]|uniref:Exonuclease domain-containing protein n=1 Tax=Diploscapter pachys TaxID=2018661 RepID=A0A2A2K2Z0_9BILA|nr:hypothetical protein WR25_11015 [Diploscapter pachys]